MTLHPRALLLVVLVALLWLWTVGVAWADFAQSVPLDFAWDNFYVNPG